MDRGELWVACQRAPMFKEPRGCWLTTPSSHGQGVAGKDGQVRVRVWALVTAGLVRAPCSCGANKKGFTFQLQFPSVNIFYGPAVSGTGQVGIEVAVRCRLCLCEADISSASYLLWAHTLIILTTLHTFLSVGPPPPPPLPISPIPPTLTDDPNTAAQTRRTTQTCFSSLQMSCVLPLVQLFRNVKGELTVTQCIHQLSTDHHIEFLKIQNLEGPETG